MAADEVFNGAIRGRVKAAALVAMYKDRKSLRASGFPALRQRALGLEPRVSYMQLDRAVYKSVLHTFIEMGASQGNADEVEVLKVLRAHAK